ncbi:hypothetical protein EniyanLRS_5 [Mycobacterium phage EniyanLRS]|uniref:Uncharacterized protein n=1 Tax=Mycobacterium phage EniyanLRS TaxID=1933770 RepID=A0A2I2MPB2_9CAUD|nr:hypothetical protein EniyanLRS_5 [Mycobacterium phage EniyanLRS]
MSGEEIFVWILVGLVAFLIITLGGIALWVKYRDYREYRALNVNEGERFDHPVPVVKAMYDALPTPPPGTRFEISIEPRGDEKHPHLRVRWFDNDAMVTAKSVTSKDLIVIDGHYYRELYAYRGKVRRLETFRDNITAPIAGWANKQIAEYKSQHYNPEVMYKVGGPQ